MSLRALNLKLLVVLAGLFLVLPASADEFNAVVPPPKAKASEENKCVAPIEEMRRNHMQKILHQRDKTLRHGVRSKQFSLAECVNCHVTPKKDGTYANFGEDEHFCSNCHNYAAVTVDCFECHRDKPENKNFRHSLINKTSPHHKDIAFSQQKTLTKDTLDVLESGESR